MTNNAKKIAEELDMVAEGFAKVPIAELPPHIKWGDDFLAWDDSKKISYLMKFAEAMNHAADTIQQERDRLGKLLEKKEKQLIQMQSMLESNNRMLQSEITRMNIMSQDYNQEVVRLKKQISGLV